MFFSKRPFLILIFVIVTLVSSGPPKKQKPFALNAAGYIVPPNTVYLFDNLFIEETEIMNVQYLEYLHHLAHDSGVKAVIQKYPDTTLFGVKHRNRFFAEFKGFNTFEGQPHLHKNKLYHDKQPEKSDTSSFWYNYFSFEGNKYLPLVGITYFQAVAYCKWRSEYVTKMFNTYIRKHNNYPSLKNKKVCFEFRLPTEQEWEFAAAGGLRPSDYPYGLQQLINTNTKKYDILSVCQHVAHLKHCKQVRTDIKAHQRHLVLQVNCLSRPRMYFEEPYPEPEFAYENKPNDYGVYNCIGNVAEMISEIGICKGGSFEDSLSACSIKNKRNYSNPKKWLGFRPVCEVHIVPDSL